MEKLSALGFVAIYDLIALLLLYQWESSVPWRRIDVFSGGYLALSAVLAVQQAVFSTRFSEREKQVFFAKHIDPGWKKWVAILGVGELAVFLDYGHLHLLPALERPALQVSGLALCGAAVVWLFWVDSWLGRDFVAKLQSHSLMTGGPYRLIRHPRYAGLLGTRLGLPLVMASGIGWALAAGWLLLVHRRVRMEEAHLANSFGELYDEYSKRTPGLFPRNAAASGGRNSAGEVRPPRAVLPQETQQP